MKVKDYCLRLIGGPGHAVSRLRRILAPRPHERPPEHVAGLARELSSDLRRGRAPRMADLSVYQHLAVLRSFIETGDIALCKAYAASPGIPLGRFRPLDVLVMLVRAAPESTAGDAGDLPARAADEGVLALRAPGRSRVVIVFTDMVRHFGCPLPLIHQWFRGLDASLVYVFDTEGTYYLGGIPALANTRAETAASLRDLAGAMGAGAICCAGNSGGGFGALAYAPLLGARRTLALSPPSTIRESLDAVCAKAPQVRSLVDSHGTVSLRNLHRQAPSGLAGRAIYPAENIHDCDEAQGIQGIAGIDVSFIAGVRDHNLVPLLISRQQFAGELTWLMSP